MLIGIFGTGRNGSSLIGRLLDGLGDTYVHPVEEKFFTSFNDFCNKGKVTRLVEQNCVSQKLKSLDKELNCSQLENYFNKNSLNEIYEHCQSTIGTPNDLEKLSLCNLIGSGQYLVEDFTRNYLEGLSRELRPDVNFKHHMFKTIETPYLAEYEKRFPDMRFIHIFRHPVTVCSSQKRSLMENKKLPASYLGYDWLSCMLEKRWVPHAKFLAEHKDDPRHIIVRYEDLVTDPKGEIKRIAEGLGIEPPPRPDEQTIFHDLDKTSWGSNPSRKGVDTPKGVVADLQKRNKYVEVLTKREIDFIAVKTNGLLEQLGYDRFSDASRLKVALQYLLLDKWEFMHWRNPRLILLGLYGIVCRRFYLFRK